jgi:L-cysteine:1D-myo-inositol 2-amino-2-deoxy-alpha-D-glucopyranoside ligase
MRLYDTARRGLVEFAGPELVTLYTCGITPYDAAHLGHAATYLAFDVLQRRLRDLGHRTRLVRNVTDVDDDILRKARELGVHYLDLAAEELARFDSSMAALGLLPAASEPRATSAIPEILSLIDAVLETGHAYRSGGAVYFDISSFGQFGEISHLDREQMLVLAAERGGKPDDPNKDDPLDFILWQPSAPDEPSWESRWGPGRPGWHVECSALALREIGPTVDIHGGGRDLVFPHHECEAAQSEAANGARLARVWMHAGMVGLDGEKMSKSLGNLVFVDDLLKRVDPPVIRLALLNHHYREDWDWQDPELEFAAVRLETWQRAAGAEPDGEPDAEAVADPEADSGVRRRSAEVGALLERVRDRLDEDLDTPAAIAAIDDAVEDSVRGEGPSGVEIQAAAALLGVPV